MSENVCIWNYTKNEDSHYKPSKKIGVTQWWREDKPLYFYKCVKSLIVVLIN